MVRKQRNSLRRCTVSVLILLGACARWAPAEGTPAPSIPDADAAPAVDSGIRFTPGMARAMASVITRQALVKRYGLDEARSKEASEKIAQRIMQTAHANDRQVQEILEYALPQTLEFEARGIRRSETPPEFWVRLGKMGHPLVPAARQLLTDIRQDVQPLLPPMQQLKMAGDLLAMGTALDAFEKAMERCARGDVKPGEDPFDTGDQQIRKDENGESSVLKEARKHAQDRLDRLWRSGWEQYVEQAGKLYEFDEAQRATADSILREAVQRAEAVAKDETWRRRAVRNRLWNRFIWNVAPARFSPLPDIINADFIAMGEPLRAIGDELRERIDRIPTQTQREAADARVRAALAELGVDAAGVASKE
jgi:hypothetical protein